MGFTTVDGDGVCTVDGCTVVFAVPAVGTAVATALRVAADVAFAVAELFVSAVVLGLGLDVLDVQPAMKITATTKAMTIIPTPALSCRINEYKLGAATYKDAASSTQKPVAPPRLAPY